MIYNITGTILDSAYAVVGDKLYSAYDFNGESVYISKYDTYTTEQIYGGVEQGVDVYGHTLAVWDDSEYRLKLRNVNDGTLIASLDLGLTSHGNDISFTNEFYSQDDEFPLLFIDGRFYRITRNEATFIRRITYPDAIVRDGSNLNYGSGFDGNYMYVMGYKLSYQIEANNFIKIAKLDMSNLTENEDGTYTPALVSTVNREWLPCIQGAAYHGDLMWACCGVGSPGHLYGFNPQNGRIEVSINLGNTGEVEGVGWGYDKNTGWFAIIGALSLSKFLKVSFPKDDTPIPSEMINNLATVTNVLNM